MRCSTLKNEPHTSWSGSINFVSIFWWILYFLYSCSYGPMRCGSKCVRRKYGIVISMRSPLLIVFLSCLYRMVYNDPYIFDKAFLQYFQWCLYSFASYRSLSYPSSFCTLSLTFTFQDNTHGGYFLSIILFHFMGADLRFRNPANSATWLGYDHIPRYIYRWIGFNGPEYVKWTVR